MKASVAVAVGDGAGELYDSPLPLVALSEEDFAKLKTDDEIQIMEDERVVGRVSA